MLLPASVVLASAAECGGYGERPGHWTDARDAEAQAALDAANPFLRFARDRAPTYRWVEARDGRSARFEGVSGFGRGPHFDASDMDGDHEAFVVRRHVEVWRGTA